ncbi:MAG: peptidase U35 [Rhizobiales bacterium 32-66-8]|nr:MAG: peptidase U35 [Rhizobiales bacterium 32-66-8]
MDRLFFETKILIDDSGAIEGLAWPFGTPDRVGDVIEKGAFSGARLPLPMLFGHDPNDPVGAWTEATEAADGLRLKCRLVAKKAAPRQGGGRTISALDLLECSLVTLPMHPGARVTSAKTAIHALGIAEAIHRAASAISKR